MASTPSRWALSFSTSSFLPSSPLGLRYDFFGLVGEHHENQANFVPGGPPTGSPMYIIPVGPNANNLSSGCATCFTDLLAKDGIKLAITNAYGQGLGTSQKTNFA